jgi:hypothetical protein
MKPMGTVTGRRSMSMISKTVAEIVGVSKTKTRKATSDLCTFMGIPHHSRSEISTIISKFIKLYSARVPILPFFFSPFFHHNTPTVWSMSSLTKHANLLLFWLFLLYSCSLEVRTKSMFGFWIDLFFIKALVTYFGMNHDLPCCCTKVSIFLSSPRGLMWYRSRSTIDIILSKKVL